MKTKYLLLIMILIAHVAIGQELEEVEEQRVMSVATDDRISNEKGTLRLSAAMLDSEFLDLEIEGAEYSFSRVRVTNSGVPFEVWFGTDNDSGSSCCFIINGQRVSGNVTGMSGIYDIFPVGGNLQQIKKIESKKVGKCGNGINMKHDFKHEPVPEDKHGTAAAMRLDGEECFVRVIVAYTAAAQVTTLATVNRTMVEQVSLAVTLANQAYFNSNMEMRMELAHLYETDDDETVNACNDLDDLQSNSDSRFNEIHNKRNFYDADMCCLLTDHVYTSAQTGCNSGGLCGLAFYDPVNEIFDYTDDATMFQITSTACIGGHSFSHEFAHVQGCRHENNTGDPFTYARGFISTPGDFRSIMARNVNPQPRLNYFSNPEVNEPNSGLAFGTATRDNARAMDFSDFTVAHHRVTPDTYSTGLNLSTDEHLNMVAVDELTSSNEVPAGASIELKSQGKVKLQPGFKALSGSVGRVHIIDQCTTSYSISNNSDQNSNE